MTAPRRRPLQVADWAVWGLPHRLLSSVLLIEAFAALLLVADLVVTPFGPDLSDALGGVGLIVGGVIHTEVALRVERIRRRAAEVAHVDLSSVWTFAAALLFPPEVACLVVTMLFTHLYVRVWRAAKTPMYRVVFNTATVWLAVHAAAGTRAYLGAEHSPLNAFGPLAIVAAMLAYTVVNTCLVVGVVVISSDRTVRQVLGQGDEIVLEIATLSLGAMLALALTVSGPLMAAFALPPLLVLNRAVLVRQLEKAANTDSKTGLLTAAAWQHQAMQQLSRARRTADPRGILILDLDHFKRVNDDHGHLAGDMVLAAVGAALRAEVRDRDIVGRFGGEEFVIMLASPGSGHAGHAELRRIAERIRQRISELAVEIPTPDGPLTLTDLSVSIGGATFPGDGLEVQDLIAVADAALYAAKRDGRNQVRLSAQRTSYSSADPPPRLHGRPSVE
ncbi:GGDEF domain-containing protein [Pseudonocardia nigra]|uniref:GGDEF domain-containing protein n=1 Tax=Pseudonocardia nigra TaxID=1921578 RepID=UPI001C5D12F5|nr:GGDEF domain-containing protein [Pseudonocardia nigra]